MELFDTINQIVAVAAFCVAAVILLWMTYTDFRYYLLPDRGNIVLAVTAIIFHAVTGFSYQSPVDMIIGSVSGALIFILSRWYGLKVKKVDGVGIGDIKFAAATGLWLGAFGVSLMILGSAIALLMVGTGVVLVTKRDFKSFYLPFGAMACPVTILLLIVDLFIIRLAILL